MNRTQATAAAFALIAGLVAASPAEGQQQGQRRGAPTAPSTQNMPTETVATSNNKYYIINFEKPVLGRPSPLEGNSIKSIRELSNQQEAMKEAFTPSPTRSPGVFQQQGEAGAALEKMIQDALKGKAPAQGPRRTGGVVMAGESFDFSTLA